MKPVRVPHKGPLQCRACGTTYRPHDKGWDVVLFPTDGKMMEVVRCAPINAEKAKCAHILAGRHAAYVKRQGLAKGTP